MVAVWVVESMCHATQSVIARCSVVTTVVNNAAKTALHAKKAVATTANTASVRRNAVNLVILVTRNASGSAGIINARNCVDSFATVVDAMHHAEGHFRAGIPVSVSVEKYARRSVASVTKTR